MNHTQTIHDILSLSGAWDINSVEKKNRSCISQFIVICTLRFCFVYIDRLYDLIHTYIVSVKSITKQKSKNGDVNMAMKKDSIYLEQ